MLNEETNVPMSRSQKHNVKEGNRKKQTEFVG